MVAVLTNPSPKQSRSRKTIEALLQAGRRKVEENGIDSLSMAEVAAAAESSVGSLYFHFGDKNQFVSAILSRALDATRGSVRLVVDAAAAARWSPREILRRWVAMKVDIIADNRALLRSVLRHTLAQPETWEPIRQFGHDAERQLLELLERARPEIAVPDWQRRVHIGMQAVSGTLMTMVIVERRPLNLDSRELKQELAEVAACYVWGGR